MKTLYESILDDEDDILDNTDNILRLTHVKTLLNKLKSLPQNEKGSLLYNIIDVSELYDLNYKEKILSEKLSANADEIEEFLYWINKIANNYNKYGYLYFVSLEIENEYRSKYSSNLYDQKYCDKELKLTPSNKKIILKHDEERDWELLGDFQEEIDLEEIILAKSSSCLINNNATTNLYEPQSFLLCRPKKIKSEDKKFFDLLFNSFIK